MTPRQQVDDMKITALLDAAKAARNIATDMALADAVGVTRAAVSAWRNGTRLPDAVACDELAKMTGLSLAQVIGIVGEARAISVKEKAVWHRLATAAVLVLAVGLASAPVKAQAALSHFVITPSLSIMCIVFLNARVFIQRVGTILGGSWRNDHLPPLPI